MDHSLLFDSLLIPDLRNEHMTHSGLKSCHEIGFVDTGRACVPLPLAHDSHGYLPSHMDRCFLWQERMKSTAKRIRAKQSQLKDRKTEP